jgi:type I restriction enzyme M protein
MVLTSRKRAEARNRYYVREEAKRIGWDVRHPREGGLFLEEQELVDFFPSLKPTLGNQRPDFGILDRNGHLRLIVESKNDYRLLDTAIKEARGYANQINQARNFDVYVAVGTAGTPDHIVQTRDLFRKGANGNWVDLTSYGYPLTQLPTPDELAIAIENRDGTTNVQLPDEREFFDTAIKISQILRAAKIEEPLRPKVVGAIILALYQGNFSFDPDVVLAHVNSNVKAAVYSFTDVPVERREFLAQTLTLSTESHRLRPEVAAIVHQLERLNVRSIMRSGVDFLGKFYEAFLRYGADSSKMGIVFTPRHITKFCADLTRVELGNTVYDPAAGTGGFLVAAFDRMRRNATTPKAIKKVKESLYGCETNSTVWALAVLNMFFRGDGKSSILFKSAFENQEAVESRFDRVLLNPPFSQEGEPETDFIDHGLRSLQPGGLLAVVVKANAMVDPDLAAWRRVLVQEHHILGVISLPIDLFYPIGVATTILLLRAHSPDRSQPTFLAKIHNDGFEISKKRRLPIKGSQLDLVLQLFHRYLDGEWVEMIPNLACTVERDRIAHGEEVCAERWLPSASFGLTEFEKHRLELVRQISLAIANYPDVIDEIIEGYEALLAAGETHGKPRERARLEDWFEVSNGRSSGAKNYPGGELPYVSSGDAFNSIVDFVEPPDNEIYDTPYISVTGFGQAYIQPWRFCARGNGGSAVRVLKPRFGMTLSELMWMVGQINSQRWRFHYGRMATVDRLKGLEVDPPPVNLPIVSGLERRLKEFHGGLNHLFESHSSDATLEDRVRELVIRWKSERPPVSTVRRMTAHPAYQELITLGDDAVPFLLAELANDPDHLFLVLSEITKVDPVPVESRGKIQEMADAWIEWGKIKGYV